MPDAPGALSLEAAARSAAAARWQSPRIKHLMDSVIDLLITKGFHETSVREISAAAGWNMATLYHYVEDKRDLLIYAEKWIHEHIDEYLVTCRPSGPCVADQLESLIDCYFRMMQKYSLHVRFLLRERDNFKPEHRAEMLGDAGGRVAAFRTLLEQGVAQGEFRPVDLDMVARDIYFLSWSWAINSSLIEHAGDFEQFLTTTKSFIIHGLRPVS